MKRRVTALDREGLAAEIANLSNARIDEFATAGRPFTEDRLPQRSVTRAIAYRLQERACGGPQTLHLPTAQVVFSATTHMQMRPLGRAFRWL